jgi:hypothetical protein
MEVFRIEGSLILESNQSGRSVLFFKSKIGKYALLCTYYSALGEASSEVFPSMALLGLHKDIEGFKAVLTEPVETKTTVIEKD